MPSTQAPSGEDLAASTVRTVTLRLMPLLGLLYLIAYIDRQNVSYAKLEMVGSLGLSETAYGLGASLFFIGYFLFEVPANVFLERVGARIWFARIMITWGIVTVLLGCSCIVDRHGCGFRLGRHCSDTGSVQGNAGALR